MGLLRRYVSKIIATRDWFTKELRDLDFPVLESKTNFVLAECPQMMQRIYLIICKLRISMFVIFRKLNVSKIICEFQSERRLKWNE